MFKSASSYLFGSKPQPQHLEPAVITKLHNKSSQSLPDLYDFKEEEKHHSPSCHSVANIPGSPYLTFAEDKMEIVLDKDTTHTLSTTCPISFLFDSPPAKSSSPTSSSKQAANRLKVRSPYYIASNRNARYVNKRELMCADKDLIKDAAITLSDVERYLASLGLNQEETKGVLSLAEWAKHEKQSTKLCHDLLFSELVVSYFASLSPTNPDLFGCWVKWVMYRSDHGSHPVDCGKLKAFIESGVFSIGFDKHNRPVWFVNTDCYDGSVGTDVITKACLLWCVSMLWNLKKQEFDLFGLRRGVSIYVNLSHWSINLMSWTILQSIKKVMVAFPFHLVDIYIANIPTFMYLIKQLAAKVVVPHAMDKFIVLTDSDDYFEKHHASKNKTPTCAGGNLQVDPCKWLEDRGFMDFVEPDKKKADTLEAELVL